MSGSVPRVRMRFLPGDLVAGEEEGEGDADRQREHGRQGAHEQAVAQAAQVVGVVQEGGVALQRKGAGFRVYETRLEDVEDRVEDGEKEDREDRHQDDVPRLKVLAQGGPLLPDHERTVRRQLVPEGFPVLADLPLSRDRGPR